MNKYNVVFYKVNYQFFYILLFLISQAISSGNIVFADDTSDVDDNETRLTRYLSSYGASRTWNISVPVGTHTFEIDGIAPNINTEWYVNNIYKELDYSGVLAVDPDYTYNFVSGNIQIKALIYSDNWILKETHIWNIVVTSLPAPPIALSATNVSSNGFTANWSPVSGSIGYFIDVSLSSSFSSYLPGYNNRTVSGSSSIQVLGLSPGVTYFYRVRAQNSFGNSGNSNTISVQTQQSSYIRVVFPNGGEKLEILKTYNIVWNDNISENVKILLKKGNNIVSTLSNSTPSSGNFSWEPSINLSSGYQIEIVSISDSTVKDHSDSTFSIIFPAINIISPNGGEILVVNSGVRIQWDYPITDNLLNIEYTIDNGLSWMSVANGISAYESFYLWTVPASPSASCKIKIYDALIPAIKDTSDSSFTIMNSPVTFSIRINSDSLVYDKTYSGEVTDTVDGSLSTVSSGSITDYIWYVNGIEVGHGVRKVVSLRTGSNYVKLKLVNETGYTATDSVRIDVYSAILKTNGPIHSGVSQIGDLYYVSSFDKSVYKFDSSAINPRPFQTSGKLQSTLSISKKKINSKHLMYVGSDDSRIYCLNSDLESMWDKSLGGMIVSTPSISSSGDIVYVGTNAYKFISLDAVSSGPFRFSIDIDGAIISSPAILELSNDVNIIYFGSTGLSNVSAKIYAIKDSAGVGSILWTREVGDSIVSSPAILSNGTNTMIYIGSRDGYLYRTRWDGYYEENWKVKMAGAIKSSPIIDESNMIYIASKGGDFKTFSSDFTMNSQPIKLFKQNYGISGTPCIGPDGTLYIGCENGAFYALDRDADSTELIVKWFFKGYAPIVAPTLITERGKIFIGDLAGNVYIMVSPDYSGARSNSFVQYKWPTFKGNNQRSLVVNFNPTKVIDFETTPSRFSLEAYPNPFNSSVRIAYHLPSSSQVLIEIFNSLGQKVVTIENGYKPKGSYISTFYNNGLYSGIYYCRLICGEDSRVIKLILLK